MTEKMNKIILDLAYVDAFKEREEEKQARHILDAMWNELNDGREHIIVVKHDEYIETVELKPDHFVSKMAIQVKDLVRCKDCRRYGDCDIEYFLNSDGDGYCNCGERRKDG